MSSVLALETPPRQAASSVEPRRNPKSHGPQCKGQFRLFNAQRVKPIDCPQLLTPKEAFIGSLRRLKVSLSAPKTERTVGHQLLPTKVTHTSSTFPDPYLPWELMRLPEHPKRRAILRCQASLGFPMQQATHLGPPSCRASFPKTSNCSTPPTPGGNYAYS
jgi:hypothetical protein